jgi:hypothetical protein
VQNNLHALQKGKEGNSFFTKDIGEVVYTTEKINPDAFFVEKHGCENLCTVIAIVHKYLSYFIDCLDKNCNSFMMLMKN